MGDEIKQINKAIGQLNRNGGLMAPIMQSDCIDALSQLNVDEALKIVSDVGNRARSIKDPTGYIRKAASNAGAKVAPSSGNSKPKAASFGGGGGGGGGYGMEDPKKISKQIGWLNQNAGLVEPIQFNDVIGPLSALPSSAALKILKDVEGKASTIKNPTSYVTKAAGNAMGGMGAAMSPRGPAMSYGMGPPVDPTGKIGKTIGWINKNVGLQQPLSYKDTVEVLSACSSSDAMRILKDVEEKGADIKNPTAYVSKAAERAAVGGGGGGGSYGGGGGGYVAIDTKQISKKIGELNKSGSLQQQLRFDETIGLLSQITTPQALRILDDLAKKGDSIKDPTGYVSKAAKNAGAGMMMAPPSMMYTRPAAVKRPRELSAGVEKASPSGESGKKISQAVGWLNKSGTLMQPLMYSEVKPFLEAIDISAAQKILEDLERAGHKINDPTGYVTAAAKRAASGDGIPPSKRQRA